MSLVNFEQQNLSRLASDVEQIFSDIRGFCDFGFVSAFGINWNGPKFSHNELPEKWINEYNQGGFLVTDPLAHWASLTTGMALWSELQHRANSGFFDLAAKNGMKYGVVFSSRDQFGRNFLTCVKEDREFEEPELVELNTAFFKLNRIYIAGMRNKSPVEPSALETLSPVA